MSRKTIEQRARECVREIREVDAFFTSCGKPDPRPQAEKDDDAAREVVLAIGKAILADRRSRRGAS